MASYITRKQVKQATSALSLHDSKTSSTQVTCEIHRPVREAQREIFQMKCQHTIQLHQEETEVKNIPEMEWINPWDSLYDTEATVN